MELKLNQIPNTAFGHSKKVEEVLAIIERLISFKPSIEKVALTNKQYSALWDSLSEETKKRTKHLAYKGVYLFKE